MRSEKASALNIGKMKEIFRVEMSRQLVWMLAAHLNTPFTLEAGVQSLITASTRLHGDGVGPDVLGGVISSLLKLRERLPDDSTKKLADGDAFQDVAGGENFADTGITSDREQPASSSKTNRKRKAKQRERSKDYELPSSRQDASIPDAQNDLDVTTTKHTGKPGKDSKVSSTWQWAVDSADISSEAVSEAFLRTADLFAYHALPIAKTKLGPAAKKKEIRIEIQSMLENTPTKEIDKWARCFEILISGDMDMLVRAEPEVVSQNQRMARITPAPPDFRRSTKVNTSNTDDDRSTHGGDFAVSRTRPTLVKHEPTERDDVRSSIQSRGPVQLGGALGHPAVSIDGSTQGSRSVASKSVLNDQARPFVVDTPITDILWGKEKFDMNDTPKVRQTIMNNLDKRLFIEVSRRIMATDRH
jgi:hypothetical protein